MAECSNKKGKATFPFVRFSSSPVIVEGTRSGQTYQVTDVAGHTVDIGKSESRGTNHLVYYVSEEFLKDYKDKLPLEGNSPTEYRKHFRAWVHKQILHSFVVVCKPREQVHWFTKALQDNAAAFNIGPEVDIPRSWVLFKIGRAVFPVHVVNNNLGEGWSDLYKDAKLKDGYRLVFATERMCIFDVVVFNEKSNILHLDWYDDKSEIQLPQGISVPGKRISPSLWLGQGFATSFGHVYADPVSLKKDLDRRLHGFPGGSPNVDSVEMIAAIKKCSLKIKGGFSLKRVDLMARSTGLKPGHFLYFGFFTTDAFKTLFFDENGHNFYPVVREVDGSLFSVIDGSVVSVIVP